MLAIIFPASLFLRTDDVFVRLLHKYSFPIRICTNIHSFYLLNTIRRTEFTIRLFGSMLGILVPSSLVFSSLPSDLSVSVGLCASEWTWAKYYLHNSGIVCTCQLLFFFFFQNVQQYDAFVLNK